MDNREKQKGWPIKSSSHLTGQDARCQAQFGYSEGKKRVLSKSQFVFHERPYTGETLNEVSAARGFCITQTRESSLQSTVCSNVFTYETILRGHCAVCRKKSHECDHCGESHSNNFIFHLLIPANPRPYMCKEYGQGFQQHGALEPHVKIQKGVCMILYLKSKVLSFFFFF